MSALTANRYTDDFTSGLVDGELRSYPVANGVEIFIGALIGLTSDGYAAPITTTDQYGFLGIATEYVDNSSGSNADLWVSVLAPPFVFGQGALLSSLTIADEDIGSTVWCATDNPADMTLSPSATSTYIGRLVRYEGEVALKMSGIVDINAVASASGAATWTLTADTTLILKDAVSGAAQRRIPVDRFGMANLSIDAGGSDRDVTLPDVNLALANCPRIFVAVAGGEDLTFKDAGGNTIATIATTERGMFFTDGASWFGYTAATT